MFLQGGRDYQVTKEDFRGWQRALKKRANTKFRLFANLNHMFVSGDGVSTPAEYIQPGHVDALVVGEIAEWILHSQKSPSSGNL